MDFVTNLRSIMQSAMVCGCKLGISLVSTASSHADIVYTPSGSVVSLSSTKQTVFCGRVLARTTVSSLTSWSPPCGGSSSPIRTSSSSPPAGPRPLGSRRPLGVISTSARRPDPKYEAADLAHVRQNILGRCHNHGRRVWDFGPARIEWASDQKFAKAAESLPQRCSTKSNSTSTTYGR